MNDFWWGVLAGISTTFLLCSLLVTWMVKTDPDPPKNSTTFEPPVSMAAFYANREWAERERTSVSFAFDQINAELHEMKSQLEGLAEQARVSKVVDEIIEKHTVSED